MVTMNIVGMFGTSSQVEIDQELFDACAVDIEFKPEKEIDLMEVRDIKKLANYARAGIGAKTDLAKEWDNGWLMMMFGSKGKHAFQAKLAQQVSRFPKTIKFWTE